MLTPKEEQVLQFITRYISLNGHAPTLEEIGAAIRVRSRGTVHRYISALEEKGHINKDGGGWRGMRLTGERKRQRFNLPLYGRISAGKPIEAIQDQQELNLPELMMVSADYLLQVKGDSMIEAGIHDGDYVAIKHTNTAQTGDIVVALVDQEEATLKRLKKRRGKVELIPENSSMEPMIYAAERVQIQGIVVSQVRLYR